MRRAPATHMQTSPAVESSFEPFGPAYTWCDGACARCPLEPRCPLARALRGSHWLDELAATASEPAEGWDAVVAHVDEPPVELPSSAFAGRLRSIGADYAAALSALLPHAAEEPARRAGLRLAAKLARLASMLAPDEPARFEPDLAWNAFACLMLIERLDKLCLDRVQSLFVARAPLPYRRFMLVRGRLWSSLVRLRRKVPSSARRALCRLVAAGRAPSPFLLAPDVSRARHAENG
jgi:hypothetical protein